MNPFCGYSSSENVNCDSIQAAIKQYANNIEHSRDRRHFYYSSQFYMATFLMASPHDAMTLMHIYLISVSIKRMLISQLKKNLCVKFMLPPRFNV